MEISEEDSFADDIESVKGDIEQTERDSDKDVVKVQVANNDVEEKKVVAEIAYPNLEEVKGNKLESFEEDLTCPECVLDVEIIPDWPQRMDAANYDQT